MKAAVGFSPSPYTELALDEALRGVTEELDGPPDLAFLFATSDHAEDMRQAALLLRSRGGARMVLGASTTGVITSEGEHEDDTGLGILALRGVKARTLLAGSDEEVEAFLRAGPADAPVVALPDPRRADPRTLARLRTSDRLLVGAGISGRGEALFGVAGTAVGEGQVGLASLDGVTMHVGVTNGASAASAFLEVTKARQRAVLELGGRPAARVFSEFVQGQNLATPDELPGLLMALVRQGDHGAEIVRPIVGVDGQSGALLFQQAVEPGAQLAFAWRETVGALRDRARMLRELLAKLDGPPVAALYFNCQGRGQSLFLEPDADAAAIRAALPDVPLLGMSSSFELAPVEGRSELHMYAGVLAVLTATR